MIELKGISKEYKHEKVLNNYDLIIETGEFLCIYGNSGVGKTTLLNILSLVERPTAGTVIFDQHSQPTKKKVRELRLAKIGYLFQSYGLIDNESVAANLVIALKGKSLAKGEVKKAMLKVLEEVSLDVELSQKVFELSGGEQQRLALARLLLKEPTYIFADEPTGNLDAENTDLVFAILQRFHNQGGTVVFVTHNQRLLEKAPKTLELKRKF